MKVVFAGTPDFAARHLQALLDSEHQVVAAYTQPDKPAGRGKKLQASAVKLLAQQHDIAIYQPETLRTEQAFEQFKSLQADVMIVVAYGQILPRNFLEWPKYGCLNVHGSILPRWRGAAPIQRALWAGDVETGVTIMQMDVGLDTGDMLLIERLAITSSDTSATLYEKLARSGPTALLQALDSIDELTPVKQSEELVTYADKLSKQEAVIDWSKSAQQLDLQIRAFTPWPSSTFNYQNKTIKVISAEPQQLAEQTTAGTILACSKQGMSVACGSGALLLTELQLPGKKAMAFSDLFNGNPELFSIGSLLTNED